LPGSEQLVALWLSILALLSGSVAAATTQANPTVNHALCGLLRVRESHALLAHDRDALKQTRISAARSNRKSHHGAARNWLIRQLSAFRGDQYFAGIFDHKEKRSVFKEKGRIES
jgi:hypothetical protein